MSEIKRALLSVSDKTNICELARFLDEMGVEIISSGGTRKVLEEEGFKVTPIEQVTGNPEAFGGRMKTLSFQISSALLYRRENSDDIKQAKELGINPIDLVVCNLYPFGEVVKRNGPLEELIENIDIGGPTMVRASAKNYRSVVTLTNTEQYDVFIKEYKEERKVGEKLRAKFALEAFAHTAAYDSLINRTLQKEFLGEKLSFSGDLTDKETKEVRYGENPHQKGYVVLLENDKERNRLASAPCLQGKELSYNNYLDADASWRCNSDLAKLFPTKNCVTVVKHSNPCGAAIDGDQLKALEAAWSGDQVSAFGSIITFNTALNADSAQFLKERFVEVVIAPSFSQDARKILSERKNLRLIELVPELKDFDDLMVRTIDGGFIVQAEDNGVEKELDIVVGANDIVTNYDLLNFGLKVTKHLKSNAIGLFTCENGLPKLIGAGMGNPNRLVSLEQAVNKARENGYSDLSQALLVSDAFFPFRDNIDLAAGHGIKSIVQPGGSIKDKEVITACEEHNISMVFTGMRHFRH